MEKTKIFIINKRYAGSFHSSDTPVGFVTSESEAEYLVDKMNRDNGSCGGYPFGYHYSSCEATAMPVEKNAKDYDKFVEKRISETQKAIDARKESASNTAAIADAEISKLKSRLEYYSGLRGK